MAQQDDAYDLRELFEEIEDDLIRNLQRNLKRHEREEEKEGFRWEMWQKAKLRNIRKFRAENRKIINEHSPSLGQKIHDAITGTFQSIKSAWDRLIEALNPRIHAPEDQSGKGLDQPAEPEENFFGLNREKIQALQETAEFHPEGKEKELPEDDQEKRNTDLENQVTKDFQQVEYAVWRSMDDIYRRTVYRAGMFLAAGTKTLDQAIDMATAEFLRNGICCIEYKDGKRVNVAAYAEMALRTAQQRARLLADGKARDEMGVHTIVVSAHANTCELCAPWQGQVLIDDVYSHGTREESNNTGYPLLSDAIRAGLLHPNCRHTLSTFFPGITQKPTVPDQKQAIITYKAQQDQRALERLIRKWKRVAEGSCDPVNAQKANEKVKQYTDELKQLLRDHPELRRAPKRESVERETYTTKEIQRQLDRWDRQRNDETKRAAEFVRKLRSGDLVFTKKWNKQAEHIEGTKQRIKRIQNDQQNGKTPSSYFDKDVDIDQIYAQYAGTGEIHFEPNRLYPEEYITLDKQLGNVYNLGTGSYEKSARIRIEYSKKGYHMYPVKERRR